MTRTYIGIDAEMTGTDYTKHKLIQIGLSIDPRTPRKNFVADVGWPAGTYQYDPESLRVIQWEHDRITAGAAAYDVETDLLAWLEEMGVKEKSIIPVGFAVRTFDMPFIHVTFPRIIKYFVRPAPRGLPSDHNPYIYRCCDLTDYTLALGVKPDPTVKRKKDAWSFDGWKRAGKRYAEAELRRLGETTTWHDALFDAKAAMLHLEFYNNYRVQPNPKEMEALLGQ